MTEKLVRDWISWIIRSQGRDCEWRVTDDFRNDINDLEVSPYPR